MRKLSELSKGESATVSGYATDCEQSMTLQRLLEMGFVIGAPIRIAHEAPFGKDPIAVEARGTLVGIRRADAALVLVKPSTSKNVDLEKK
jgi:ferrous iron transport protein A